VSRHLCLLFFSPADDENFTAGLAAALGLVYALARKSFPDLSDKHFKIRALKYFAHEMAAGEQVRPGNR
jgi:hypothetical protein